MINHLYSLSGKVVRSAGWRVDLPVSIGLFGYLGIWAFGRFGKAVTDFKSEVEC